MTNEMVLFQQRMRDEGLDEHVIALFEVYYTQWREGATGKLSDREIMPPDAANLVDYATLAQKDPTLLDQLVVIKLNGGLGTSMGLTKAKSLLPVKGNFTFLDIIANQILISRQRTGKQPRLMFMDSFTTREDTLQYLTKYPQLRTGDLPLDFIQNKYPRIRRDNGLPLTVENDKENWNPPGHGDIYAVLSGSGLLEKLLAEGIRYAFVSNADNLGATIDERILTWFAQAGIPFAMEVCERTEMDRKGGHLAQDKQGSLLLREVAQCPEDEVVSFQDIGKYAFFNTNNLWIDLQALSTLMQEQHGILALPLIINPKQVEGTAVIQLETAMGAAIHTFTGSRALVVPRSRFAPVKKTNDLLALWSDLYYLADDFTIRMENGVTTLPMIQLEEANYGAIGQLQERFRRGVPSLRQCSSLSLNGPFDFGPGVVCVGKVALHTMEHIHLEHCKLTGEINYTSKIEE